MENILEDCTLCPRRCHVNRLKGQTGYCGQTAVIKAARAALHAWEEPCLSGVNGAGAVFFSGCNLGCVYCQNYNISLEGTGQELDITRLAHIFLNLQKQGAHNIDLVTPTHFVPQIREALLISKANGLHLPIVYNTGNYESPETLKLLDGLVDIYLPDMKYFSAELSLRYSHAEDYFVRACDALAEMVRQVGSPRFSEDTGLLAGGVIVRVLLLPGQTKDAKKILRYLHTTYGDDILISILSQYTPLPHVSAYPELARPVTAEEYDRVVRFAQSIGIQNGYLQEQTAADESFIPAFNGEGLEESSLPPLT